MRIERSPYCAGYKNRKKGIGQEEYWKEGELEGIRGKDKEQWVRLRCGNVGNYKYRSRNYEGCNICGEEEDLEGHVWKCRGMHAKVEEEKREWLRV